MKAEIHTCGLELILSVLPETEAQLRQLKDFANDTPPITAEIRRPPHYKFPHLEIRRNHP